MRHRRANAWDDWCLRAQRSNVSRSAAVSSIAAVGRPRCAMVLLRCWSTTPDERVSTEKIPVPPNFFG
jgi:hypothetical protein